MVFFHGWQWIGQPRQALDRTVDNAAAEPNSDADEAKYFVNALRTSRVNLNDYKIILFEINGHNNNDNRFIDEVERLIKRDESMLADNFAFLRLENKLSDDMYFIYDDHLSSRGHRLLGDEIVKLIH